MERNLLSIAQQFSGLPMDGLIGGPLNAAAKANANMAYTQTQFLLETCFVEQKVEKKTTYKPIMIEMSLERPVVPSDLKSGEKLTTVTTAFNLPILTILPINSLAVDEVDISFDMEVKSSFSEDTSENSSKESRGEASFAAKVGWGFFSATVKGSASYSSEESKSKDTHYEKSNSARYAVKVHAGQLPLPQGVTTIINAFASSIEPIEVTSSKGDSASSDKDSSGGTAG